MVNKIDEKIYSPKSFNEQMSWIDESIEHIIKHGKIKKDIQERGRASYGKQGYTHAIHRLFEIIKADPKNKAVLGEVYRAEQELMSYLYDEPDALPEAQIAAYWNNYLQAYIAELESRPMHYVLVKGLDVRNSENNNEILGVYDSLEKLQDAYVIAFSKLEEQHKNMTGLLGKQVDYIVKHEKVMINTFDEFIGHWQYHVDPDQLFWKEYPSE